MVNNDITGLDFETDQVGVVIVGPYLRNRLASGPGKRISGYEPVGTIGGADPMRASQIGHST
jgi:hypothetical protein